MNSGDDILDEYGDELWGQIMGMKSRMKSDKFGDDLWR